MTFLLVFSLGMPEVYSQQDSLGISPEKTEVKKQKKPLKSPTGAVIRSLAMPGWGQVYVESYWKAPIFVSGWGTCLFFIVDNHNKFKDAEKEYANYTGTDTYEKNYLYKKREYFRDYRDLNAFFLAGIYIISAVDAYVGANLYEFNVDEQLSLNCRVNSIGNPQFGVTVKF